MQNNAIPKLGLLRRQISAALLIKIAMLTGLWFLLHRWPERPVTKPDIAAHFALPDLQTTKESQHVR